VPAVLYGLSACLAAVPHLPHSPVRCGACEALSSLLSLFLLLLNGCWCCRRYPPGAVIRQVNEWLACLTSDAVVVAASGWDMRNLERKGAGGSGCSDTHHSSRHQLVACSQCGQGSSQAHLWLPRPLSSCGICAAAGPQQHMCQLSMPPPSCNRYRWC
jgi:hypothetical protein